VTDRAELYEVARAITRHVLPGREDDAAEPGEQDWRETLLLAMPLDEASAKVRTGPPGDDPRTWRSMCGRGRSRCTRSPARRTRRPTSAGIDPRRTSTRSGGRDRTGSLGNAGRARRRRPRVRGGVRYRSDDHVAASTGCAARRRRLVVLDHRSRCVRADGRGVRRRRGPGGRRRRLAAARAGRSVRGGRGGDAPEDRPAHR
jgi:hypothetical protein